MINTKQISFRTKYFFVFILIAISGMPFFTAKDNLINSLVFLIAISYFIVKRNKIDKFLYKTILFLLIIVGFQIGFFGTISFITTIGLFIRWLIPFFIIVLVGRDFPKIYVNIIYFLAIISFIFFIPSIIIPGFENYLLVEVAPFFQQEGTKMYSYDSNILIYTIKTGGEIADVRRNSGPFWEPGAFAGYTLVAFFFNLILSNKLINHKNIVFILSIISTVSIAGYLGFFIFLFFYFIIIKKNKRGWLLAPLVVYLSFNIFQNVERVNIKLTDAYYDLKLTNVSLHKRSRVISAMVDIQDISKSPLWGKGRSSITRFGKEEVSRFEHRNNGVTNFAVQYGIPFWLFYFYFMFYSIKSFTAYYKRNKYIPVFIMLSIFVIGFAEVYFQQSFFIALFYLHLVYKNTNNKRIVNYENLHQNTYPQ